MPIFTAVREQLGLTLEPARAPVEVLVIEAAERPGENSIERIQPPLQTGAPLVATPSRL